MSTLHETQPTIQQLLTSSDFSGALDLITTSCEILSVHLNGVHAFRHLVSQLKEIQGIIGKMLLADFEVMLFMPSLLRNGNELSIIGNMKL